MMNAFRQQLREYNAARVKLANDALNVASPMFRMFNSNREIERFCVRFDGVCFVNPGPGAAALYFMAVQLANLSSLMKITFSYCTKLLFCWARIFLLKQNLRQRMVLPEQSAHGIGVVLFLLVLMAVFCENRWDVYWKSVSSCC